VGRDPTLGLTKPKVRAGEPDGRVRPEDVPTRAEVLTILDATPARFRAAVALGVTGLRIGEVLAVTADRLDSERRRLLVDRQLQRIAGKTVFTGPKAEKVRTVTLPGAVVLEVRRHLRDHQGGGVLFRGGRGALMRRDAFYKSAWRPALAGAGLAPDRFVFHSLRHFAASSMLAEGAPITAVAGHLGDTVETIERTYAAANPVGPEGDNRPAGLDIAGADRDSGSPPAAQAQRASGRSRWGRRSNVPAEPRPRMRHRGATAQPLRVRRHPQPTELNITTGDLVRRRKPK
jgi:integrase